MSIFLSLFGGIGYNIRYKGMNEYVSCYRKCMEIFEPWWFLEGWEEDIVASKKFDQYYDALKYYKTCWFRLEQESPLYKSRSDLMTIFWDPEDQRWCDECDEYLQQYHSLALLQDEQVIPDEKLRPGYEKQTGQERHRACRMKLK